METEPSCSTVECPGSNALVIAKRPLGPFLKLNPFPNGWTDGLFYREKMRAIHGIAPPRLPSGAQVLEIGGGRSGMASSLYPNASVTTVDNDPALADVEPDRPNGRFVIGDACDLPFLDGSFDVVTLFDVLEHIPDDRKAAEEARRVTKPGGHVLISTPRADWRYPFYAFMAPLCPHECLLMDEWGHVRRGYTAEDLSLLFHDDPTATFGFINRVTAFYHDIAFSKLGPRKRKLLYALAALPTAVAYALHNPRTHSTEIAAAWRR